jgi:hypothetical protein
MIEFNEIDNRLKKLGKTREWLALETGRSAGAIRSALAPNAGKKHRSEHLQRALSDAIERAESKDETVSETPNLPDRLTIEVSPERMNLYCEAAEMAHMGLKSWAIHELNRAAEEWAKQKTPVLRVAEDPPETRYNAGGK